MVDTVLKAILLLSPLFYVRDIPINNCDFFFYHFSVIALFIASMFDTPKRAMAGKRLIAYAMGLCLFSVLTHKFNVIVSNYAVNAFFAMTALTIIVTYCKDYKSCYKYIAYAGLINIAIYLVQRAGFSPILQVTDTASMGAIIGNRPRFVIYACLLLPYLYSVNKWLLVPAVIVTALTAPNEFTLPLACLIFLLMHDVGLRWKVGVVALSIVAVALCHHHFMMAMQFRAVVIGQSLVNFFNAPLYGLGLGVYPLGQEQMTTSKIDYAIYSSIMQFIVCGGLLTIPLLYEGMKRFVRYFRNSVPCKVLVILGIVSCIDYPLEIIRLWMTIIATVAFFTIQAIENPVARREKKDDICEYLV